MATIKSFCVTRNAGKKDKFLGNVAWDTSLKEGDEYDCVQFTINELSKPYFWRERLGLRCGLSESEIRKVCDDIAATITPKQIKNYEAFIKMGEETNWE